ncbi:hypothetical protein BASA81_002321 [Batrachochytrium salamandrivorans]|nr:hypothetical protein BASA81_002321 [Batrachochytrium salamandrivorans]
MISFALLALLAGLFDLATFATAKRLAGGGLHFIMLQRDGQVFGGGYNGYGQLGLGTTSNSVVLPQAMLSVTNATDVSTGVYHSCILDNQVKCTGSNSFYQLGDGTDTERHMLVPTLGLASGIEEVYCGYYGGCAKTASGGAQCWGYFAGSTGTSPATITISGGVQSISLGYAHDCFVAIGGKLYCMGNNDVGQLGTGDLHFQTAPIQVAGLAAASIVSVACGETHTCVVSANGAMFCWGESDNGRLGNPSITSDSSVPVQVLGITSGAASAWTGTYNSFALMQNGTVGAFGKDGYGVFGTGSNANQLVPIAFGQGVSGVVEIRGGYYTTCVLLQNDQVKCTGNNANGQLGVGNYLNSKTLVGMQLPTSAPTKQPSAQPTLTPTKQPTLTPSAQPATTPTTPSPTKRPTKAPTATPTKRPTKAPTTRPTKRPTNAPTKGPTKTLTAVPTRKPTNAPTKKAPTNAPTKKPTKAPTAKPTKRPTKAPTKRPTKVPTKAPTKKPTTAKPAAAS